MITTIASSLGLFEDQISIYFAVFIRVGACLALLPAFGEQVVPARIKLVIAVMLAALVFTLLPVGFAVNLDGVPFTTLLFTESLAGLLIGFIFRCLIFLLQICGTIAAQSVSLSQSFGAGLGVDPQPAFSTLLVVGGLALLTHLDWHLLVSMSFLDSYEILPAGRFPEAGDFSETGIQRALWAFNHGFAVAASFVFLSLIYNFGLGFINKAMPQLMVAFVGAPAISFLGILFLFLASPAILKFWATSLVPLGPYFGSN